MPTSRANRHALNRFWILAVVAGLVLALAPAAQAADDTDGDGTPDSSDCKPLDPAVAPGKADKPDLTFEDTNCDGIDGDESKAIFVSLGGNDAATGTKTNPMRTIAVAVSTAIPASKDVYIAGGSHDVGSGDLLADNVGLYGGYAPITGGRSPGEVTTITGSPQALLANGDQGVVLQLLTLVGNPDVSGSAYGLRMINGSTVLLEKVTARASSARNGATGTGGPGSGPSFNGGSGATGTCGSDSTPPPAAAGGIGGGFFFSRVGGNGGAGGRSSSIFPTPNTVGSGNISPFAGVGGQVGPTGAAGTNAVFVRPVSPTWSPAPANAGTAGQPGSGGNGGAGGLGRTNVIFLIGTFYAGGGGGGGGGAGGWGGGGGGAGSSGGGSFGAFISESSVVAVDSTLTGGDGGSGGNGGLGGSGGAGGAGGSGGGVTACSGVAAATSGTQGGAGGTGGVGGRGGGGTGGPSAGVYRSGNTSSYTDKNTAELVGAAGGGGAGSSPAPAGQALDILTPPGTATATTDFDGDGATDASDLCPGTVGTSNGCPVRPAVVVPPVVVPPVVVPPVVVPPVVVPPVVVPPVVTPPVVVPPVVIPPKAPAIRSLVTMTATVAGKRTTLKTFAAAKVPKGAKVTVKCKTALKGCPFASKAATVKSNKANLLALFGAKRTLKTGAVVEVRVTKAGMIGQAVRYTMRKGKLPLRAVLCLPVGSATPRATC